MKDRTLPSQPALVNKDSHPRVLDQIEELRLDAKSSKDRHFAASDRKLGYHKTSKTLALLLEILVTGILLYALVEFPTSLWLRFALAIASLVALFLTALQINFGFDKHAEGHRSIANRYIEVSRRCKLLQGRFHDSQITIEKLWTEFTEIERDYQAINQDADEHPTSAADDQKALENLEQPRTKYKP